MTRANGSIDETIYALRSHVDQQNPVGCSWRRGSKEDFNKRGYLKYTYYFHKLQIPIIFILGLGTSLQR